MKCSAIHFLKLARAGSVLRPGGIALAAVTLLAACSPTANAPATAGSAPATALVAVARGRIDIEGGLLALATPRDGTVVKVAVHEGDQVRQGQLLALLDTEPATLAVDTAQAEVAQAQAQLKLLAIKQAAAKQRATRLTAAAQAGAGDGQSADDAREAAAQLGAEQQAAQASLGMSQQKLGAARYELKLRGVLAPFDAQVTHVSVQPGASVSPSSGALFTLLPAKPRIVRAELNESFVGLVKPGMHAEVTANNSAQGASWSAHVLRVGQVYGPTTLENDPQVRANARSVECVLAFDQPQDLRIGQRVLVRFDAAAQPAPRQAPAKD
jgi:multidrug resistance efflux pump